MPGIVRPRSPSDLDENESAAQSDRGSEQSNDASPRTVARNKRARLNLSANRNGDVDESWMLSPPGGATAAHSKNQGLMLKRREPRRSRSGAPKPQFKPGQIVRVSLENFVTYTAATFHPGPALNMVIGPNGTGKSTLVCALCIGLGWSPNLLGRAKELCEFVKHGCTRASIEIELKGQEGHTNPVIRRDIIRDGSKYQFYINGTQKSITNVRDLGRSFNVQIDNLCQFLPQDRVVEFSRLSPRDRLQETQKAAASPQMQDWHLQLKRFRGEQVQVSRKRSELGRNLQNLEGRQNLQRADVERMKERNVILKKVELLEKSRPFSESVFRRIEFHREQKRYKKVLRDFKALEEAKKPAMAVVNGKKVYERKVGESAVSRNRALDRCKKEVEKCEKQKKEAGDNIKTCERKREEKMSNAKEQRDLVKRLETTIINLESQQENRPPEFDAAAYNSKIHELDREVIGLKDQIVEKNTIGNKAAAQVESRKCDIKNTEDEIKNLQSQAGQQRRKLKDNFQDVWTAWNYVNQNRQRFKGKVFGPPLVECSVKDPQYVNMLESIFQKSVFGAITCTDQQDFNFLSKELRGRMKLARITLRTTHWPLDHPANKPPVDSSEMQRLGISSWALDHLDGPPEVLSMLCNEESIHATAVVLKEFNEEEFRAMEDSLVSRWVTPNSINVVRKRKEYGDEAKSTTFRSIAKARFWNYQGIDTAAESNLKARVAELHGEIDELHKQRDSVKERVSSLRERKQDAETERDALREEKDSKQRIVGDWNRIPQRIENRQKEIGEAKDKEKEAMEFVRNEEQKREDLTIRRAQLAVEKAGWIDNQRKMYEQVVIAKVAHIEAMSEVEVLEEENISIKTELEQRGKEVKALLQHIKNLNAERERAEQKVKNLREDDDETTEFWEGLTDDEKTRTPEEVSIEIESQQARVDLLQGGDPHAITEFERRAARIDQLRSELSTIAGDLSDFQQTINEIRAKWEPELDTLVSQISAAFASNFEKIGCAGEVSVDKATSIDDADQPGQPPNTDNGPDENEEPSSTSFDPREGNDFENWAININVKFREGEQLSLLDSHRQSGGERAVSTIFYLMALQNLSRAPFRVVDEINQGMDPRNERKVHELMVDIACGEAGDGDTGSQYFLITPKLLSGLKFHPGMKVHCIVSGEFMPPSTEDRALDFGVLIERAKEARRERGEEMGRANLVGAVA